jgi:DNA-binding response OmpR family regulator
MQPGILIVDDEDFILLGLGDYFRSQGYTVDCARDVEQATALLRDIHYELVIADVRLTRYGGEGLSVIDQVKRRSPGTSTVLLTGVRSPELEEEARDSGVDLVLDKPFLLEKVGAAAADLLHRFRQNNG